MQDESARTTSGHQVASRGEWLAARLALLEQEKELTRRSDELARQRAALPWVPVDKDYTFVTATGEATLADLFSGRSQLVEQPGMSGFVRDGGKVFHAYSAYARGLDALWGAYQWLDRAPLGRNEDGYWWHLHDEYER
jgi:predicted dithiol-disulfide oxidoreductase (DUF899 family)